MVLYQKAKLQLFLIAVFENKNEKKKEKYITCVNICLTLIDIKLRHQLVIPIEISSRRIITVIKP